MQVVEDNQQQDLAQQATPSSKIGEIAVQRRLCRALSDLCQKVIDEQTDRLQRLSPGSRDQSTKTPNSNPLQELQEVYLAKLVDDSVSPLICYLAKPLEITDDKVFAKVMDRLKSLKLYTECTWMIQQFGLCDSDSAFDLNTLLLEMVENEDLHNVQILADSFEKKQALLEQLELKCKTIYENLDQTLKKGLNFSYSDERTQFEKVIRQAPKLVSTFKQDFHDYPALATSKRISTGSWIISNEVKVRQAQPDGCPNDLSG
ncbi:hypothetical protein HDV05_001014, partial [Chytridiales sp. JEL 0842]